MSNLHTPATITLTATALVAVGIHLLGCSGSSQPQNVAPSAIQPGTSGDGSNAVDVQTQRQINELVQRVSEVRNLPVKFQINGRVIDRPTMVRQLQEHIRTEVPSDAVAGESAFLQSFGFVPLGFDYEAQTLKLMEAQIAGYYDPDAKTLFVMSDIGGAEAEIVLAHELIHALQDQHFGVGSHLKYRENAGDAISAFSCLAEGDATSAQFDYMLSETGTRAVDVSDTQLRLMISSGIYLDPDVVSIPRIMKESLVSPYVDGVIFVHSLRRQGGWALVNEIWQNPPTTTEQVLHLDKLMSREPAEVVEKPRTGPGAGFSAVYSEVYGEQDLRNALEEWMPKKAAAKAAAGWAGDRATVWQNRDLSVAIGAWQIRFDHSGTDGTDEANEAFQLIAGAWDQIGKPAPCRPNGNGGHISLVRRGRDIVFVAGPKLPGNDASTSACDLLSAWGLSILADK